MSRPYSLDLRDRGVASGQGGGLADGLAQPAVAAGRRAGLAAGAGGGATGPDAAGNPGGTPGARHSGEPEGDLELLSRRGSDVQKKACTPPSRIAPTWRAGARGGRSIKDGLTPGAWSSSMRPGRRPT